MQIILLDDVPGLGLAGEIVKVKDGYARNYLLPQGLAEKLTAAVFNRIEQIKRVGEARRIKRIEDAKDKIKALDGKKLLIPMKAGAENKLFGAVTTILISERIREEFGFELDRRFILLSEPIKYLGEFQVPLRASDEAIGKLTLLVVDEAIFLAQGAEAALAQIRGEEIPIGKGITEAKDETTESDAAEREVSSALETASADETA